MSAAPVLAPLQVEATPERLGGPVSIPTHLERARPGQPGAGFVQDLLAVDFTCASDDQLFGPQPTPSSQLPPAAPWAARMCQALVEVMHGARPAAQVMRWTTPEVHAALARRGASAARRGVARGLSDRTARPGTVTRTVRTRVTRVRVCHPCADVAECAVVVIDGTRVRAVAMRLIGRDGRWVVEALQVG